MSGEVLVRADLAAALPGGPDPVVLWVRWWRSSFGVLTTPYEAPALLDADGLCLMMEDGRAILPAKDCLIPLPGPGGINAAALLWKIGVTEVCYFCGDTSWAWGSLPTEVVEACRLPEEPKDDWEALRRLVHHVGRLYAVARAVGLEPAPGEWPGWTRDEEGRWTLRCGPVCVIWTPYVGAQQAGVRPLPPGAMKPDHHYRNALIARNGVWGTCTHCPRRDGMVYPEECWAWERHDHQISAGADVLSDPYEALRAVHAEVCS